MQRDCRMCKTVEQNVVDERAEVGFFLRSRIEGTKKPGWIQTLGPLFPSRRLPRPRGPFGFLSSPCFLPPFLPRCRPVSPVNIASHVVSEGFCESADDCRRVICRFLAWRQSYRERKRAGSDSYGTKKKREGGREGRMIWSGSPFARSSLRCCTRRTQCYKWSRCYAYPNGSRRYVQEREEKGKIFIEVCIWIRFRNANVYETRMIRDKNDFDISVMYDFIYIIDIWWYLKKNESERCKNNILFTYKNTDIKNNITIYIRYYTRVFRI